MPVRRTRRSSNRSIASDAKRRARGIRPVPSEEVCAPDRGWDRRNYMHRGVLMEQGPEMSRRSGGMGAAQAYELVRKELLTEFGADFFRSYLEPLRLVGEWKGILLFRAASAVAQERLKQMAQHRIEARLRAHDPALGAIDILLEREFPEDLKHQLEVRIEPAIAEAAAPKEHPLSYTFDSFCVDQTNFRAFTVAQMVATGAGRAFPISLLHSQPGCGKSHLLQGIAYEAALRTPERRVLFMTGQEFLESFQSALHKKRDTSGFKELVRGADLLLIDDFHRICGKKATEEEAFDAMSDLTRRGGQVVLAANHGAEGLQGLDDSLRAKLKGATACEILEPGLELRRAILEMRVRHYARVTPGFSVASDALDMIAERMHVTGRELDGAVSQLVVEFNINGGIEVSLDATTNALSGKLADSAEKRITVQLVQKVVARYNNMSVPQLLERTRRHAIARPRQIAMFLASRMTHASLPDIGQRFGGFDHTTVLYARDRIAELMDKDPKFRQEIEGIARLVRREP